MHDEVPPLVKQCKMIESQDVCRVHVQEGFEINREAVEVARECLEGRVTRPQLNLGNKLTLYDDTEVSRYFPGDNVGGFRIKVATEALEARTEQCNQCTKVLFREGWWWDDGKCRCDLRIESIESWEAVVLPAQKGVGRHCVNP